MGTRSEWSKLVQEALDTYTANDNNTNRAAAALGIARTTFQGRLRAAKLLNLSSTMPRRITAELAIPAAPDPNEPIEDLIERKKAQYTRGKASHEFQKLISIGVKDAEPVVIAAIGDPHVDDDGCDIDRLLSDMRIIGRTPGMYPLHLGDITNNWVGRLGRLYAHQSTKASDGIRLAEHIFKLAPPLAVVGGNHDLWNEGMSWLNFCVRQAGCDILQSHGVRLGLNFPTGQVVRIHARHDFPGHSQFNPLHALGRNRCGGIGTTSPWRGINTTTLSQQRLLRKALFIGWRACPGTSYMTTMRSS